MDYLLRDKIHGLKRYGKFHEAIDYLLETFPDMGEECKDELIGMKMAEAVQTAFAEKYPQSASAYRKRLHDDIEAIHNEIHVLEKDKASIEEDIEYLEGELHRLQDVEEKPVRPKKPRAPRRKKGSRCRHKRTSQVFPQPILRGRWWF